MKSFSQFIVEEGPDLKTATLSFVRMNPPTPGGHGKVVQAGKDIQRKEGGTHEIVISGSQDPERNPLTPEQKLKHAQRLFPDTNFMLADKENPTLIHHAARLAKQGHTKLNVVAGGDRVNEFQNLLNKYNGQPDKHGNIPFHFPHGISVTSAGDRDGDAESATRIRNLVKTGNRVDFMKAYEGMNPRHAEELYGDIANGQKKK